MMSKKDNNSNTAKQIYMKISPQVEFIMLNIFYYVRIWLNLTVLEIHVYAKKLLSEEKIVFYF